MREGKAALLMPGKDEVQVPPMVPTGPREEREGGSVCHDCLMGVKIPSLYLSFPDATLADVGMPWYSLVEY